MKSNWNSFAINPLMNVATSLLMMPTNDNKSDSNLLIGIISSPTLVYPYTYDINNIYELNNDTVIVTSAEQKPIINIYGVGVTYLIIALLFFTISFVIIQRKDVS
ncbi:hypothetical protein [Spiroplasma endosymbiont of Nebria brevicollis]|uniref:hypothetical protein n=1 Tax=Spiroplasma endosymbiont of Nebria brevicollis TaxID=3066284 RepID=UPI00313C1217